MKSTILHPHVDSSKLSVDSCRLFCRCNHLLAGLDVLSLQGRTAALDCEPRESLSTFLSPWESQDGEYGLERALPSPQASQVRLWLARFPSVTALVRKAEAPGVLRNASFPLLLARTLGDFSCVYCNNGTRWEPGQQPGGNLPMFWGSPSDWVPWSFWLSDLCTWAPTMCQLSPWHWSLGISAVHFCSIGKLCVWFQLTGSPGSGGGCLPSVFSTLMDPRQVVNFRSVQLFAVVKWEWWLPSS